MTADDCHNWPINQSTRLTFFTRYVYYVCVIYYSYVLFHPAAATKGAFVSLSKIDLVMRIMYNAGQRNVSF